MAQKKTKKKAKTSKGAAASRSKKTARAKSAVKKAVATGGAKKVAKRKAAKTKTKTKMKAKAGLKTRKAATPSRSAGKKTASRGRRGPTQPELTPQERRAAAAAQRKRLRAFGRLLLERREALLQAYHATKVDTRDSKTDGTEDYIDYAVSSYDRDFTLSLTEMERRQLLLVEEALARVKRKEYGKCLNCQQPIPEKRLEVEPWARFCIRCQELEEQGMLEERAFDTDFDEEDEDEGESEGEAEQEFDSEDDESSDDEELSL